MQSTPKRVLFLCKNVGRRRLFCQNGSKWQRGTGIVIDKAEKKTILKQIYYE